MSAGERARDAGVSAAGGAAPPAWSALALAAVRALAVARDEFTVDDVWELLDDVVDRPREPRALGAVLTEARGGGLCAPTDRFQACARESRHAAPVRVWRSLLRGEPTH